MGHDMKVFSEDKEFKEGSSRCRAAKGCETAVQTYGTVKLYTHFSFSRCVTTL